MAIYEKSDDGINKFSSVQFFVGTVPVLSGRHVGSDRKTVAVAINNCMEKAYEVKVFLWDSLSKLTPLIKNH